MSERRERQYVVTVTDMENGSIKDLFIAAVYDSMAEAEAGKMREMRKAGSRMAPCSVSMDGFSRCIIMSEKLKRIIEIHERERLTRSYVKVRRL